MPPVAQDFAAFLNDLLDEERGSMSVRELSRRLHRVHPEQSAASWRRTIGRYRKSLIQPTEETISLFARALGVRRRTLPSAPPRPSVGSVAARLEVLAGVVAEIGETVVDLMDRVVALEAHTGLDQVAPKDRPAENGS